MNDEKLTQVQKLLRERVAIPVKFRKLEPFRIQDREDLAFLANELGVRLDWHEPDEQNVTALAFGRSFGNDGFWGEPTDAYEYHVNEQHVVLYKSEYPVASVNLATLFAWATEDRRGWKLGKTEQQKAAALLKRMSAAGMLASPLGLSGMKKAIELVSEFLKEG